MSTLWKNKSILFGLIQKTQQRSYTQAIRGGKADSDQKGEGDTLPHIRVNAETSFWLERCFIGKLLKATDEQVVKESFILGGFNLVRIAWFRCRGISLALWNNQCFERIGALLGTLIEADDGTVSKDVLDYARLRIRIPFGEGERSVKPIKINDTFC
ncbi:hypothetical protein VNO80_22663 [Phaseolus coccineus]|uniref:DUF4283 domain-containing protein n=1 Tax=Phaseolus coccineus TaxID=3886 RepID=A0AAN9M8D1_PHACN